jgi:ATP-dependent Clp protease protease subunit
MQQDNEWSRRLSERLFEQRVVLLHGELDDQSASRATAELMSLDAIGDAAVSLRIDCASGSLALALTVMDVIQLLGVPVRGLGLGQVGGPAVGILAVCSHRAAMPSTRFNLCEPRTQMGDARASEVARWAELRADERRRFCDRLAEAAGQPPDAVSDDVTAGRYLSAEEARAYGLIDEVCRPDADIHQLPGPPIGFRPRR